MSQVYRALERAEKERRRKSEEEPFLGIFREDLIPPKEGLNLETIDLSLEKIEVPSKVDVPIGLAPPDSFAEEQFRKLKAFLFRHSPQPPRMILITSSAQKEGKTMVAMNLAMAISQEIHKKVILIDADLRKAGIYSGEDKNRKGLSNYLMSETTLAELLIDFEAKNLVTIPSGTYSPKAAELIGSNKMKDLLRDLRKFGEDTYVIVDSPPVLSTSEPLLLSEWVDGVILVVKGGQVPRDTVRRVVDSIGYRKILGVVFNRQDLKPSKNHSGYYPQHSKK
jgi:capsular exopolysaccharide synthesis family protein